MKSALTIIIWSVLVCFAFSGSLLLLNEANSILNAMGLICVFLIWYSTYKSQAGLKIVQFINQKLTPKNKK